MPDQKFFLNNLWRDMCRLPELEEEPETKFDIEKLRKSEWSSEFEELMHNRLIMGAFRYGLLHADNKPKYDRVSSAISRLQKYQITGNQEHLVDAANLCLMEFEEGDHPNKHFSSTDDGEHAKQI